ncbi:MAG TPA: hypothetical protein VFR00_10220 [Hyphomicrobiaceae bacterium]|nr:hypothetical protein [Hyphomicrobiaceae bacterium]
MSNRVRAIAIEAVTHFDVCCSGQHVEIGYLDHGGKPGRLYLSHASLGSLLLGLAAALQETGAGGSAELESACAPFLLDWRLTPERDEEVIVLSLKATNSVEVAFRLPRPLALALGQALRNAGAAPPSPQARQPHVTF